MTSSARGWLWYTGGLALVALLAVAGYLTDSASGELAASACPELDASGEPMWEDRHGQCRPSWVEPWQVGEEPIGEKPLTWKWVCPDGTPPHRLRGDYRAGEPDLVGCLDSQLSRRPAPSPAPKVRTL